MKNWLRKFTQITIPLIIASSLVMAATAPFDPDETKPADTDVVSQYPAIERTFRDIIESWLVIDHDKTVGGHDQLTLIDQTSDPTFAANQIGVWNNGDVLSTRVASGAVTILTAIPVGTVVDYAGSTAPTGWLLTFGQCVNRVTFAALFVVLSTTYDNACSGTEFGIPDTRGRVVAGEDDMGGTSANRLTDLADGLNGDTLGDTGGSETEVLSEAELAAHTHVFTGSALAAHTHSITFDVADNLESSGGSAKTAYKPSESAMPTASTNPGATKLEGTTNVSAGTPAGTNASVGSGTAFGKVQPTIILVKIIKT